MADVRQLRLCALGLTRRPDGKTDSPAKVARHLLALQGQDLTACLWAVGVRSHATLGQVEAGFNCGQLVRSWPLRGTLHVTAAEDFGWLRRLTAGPTVDASRHRRWEQLGISRAVAEKTSELAADILRGGRALRRDDLIAEMEARDFTVAAAWKYHLTRYLSQTGMVVYGPIKNGEQLLVLASDWIAKPRLLEGEEALAELAVRYVASHGPATMEDLMWWCGLGQRAVSAGLAAAGKKVASVTAEDGRTYWLSPELAAASPAPSSAVWLLPAFDEHLLGYADRTAVLPAAWASQIYAVGNGVFKPTVVAGGVCVGTWKGLSRSTLKTLPATRPVPVTVYFSDPAAARHCDRQALQAAADDYARYWGRPSAEVVFGQR